MDPETTVLLVILALLWTIPWKGVALWKSARNGQLVWFIVLLLVNTLAILDILYIFSFQKRNQVIRVKSAPAKPSKAPKKPAKRAVKKKSKKRR